MIDLCPSDASPSQAALCDILERSIQDRDYESPDEYLGTLERAIGRGPLMDLHSALTRKYGLPGLGTSRVSYLSKSTVFKVPISPEGFRYNDYEFSLISSGLVEEANLARTRLVQIRDIPVLVMERVTPVSPLEIRTLFGSIPDWVYAIDTAQVGLSRRGVLKAYDYADLM